MERLWMGKKHWMRLIVRFDVKDPIVIRQKITVEIDCHVRLVMKKILGTGP